MIRSRGDPDVSAKAAGHSKETKASNCFKVSPQAVQTDPGSGVMLKEDRRQECMEAGIEK